MATAALNSGGVGSVKTSRPAAAPAKRPSQSKPNTVSHSNGSNANPAKPLSANRPKNSSGKAERLPGPAGKPTSTTENLSRPCSCTQHLIGPNGESNKPKLDLAQILDPPESVFPKGTTGVDTKKYEEGWKQFERCFNLMAELTLQQQRREAQQAGGKSNKQTTTTTSSSTSTSSPAGKRVNANKSGPGPKQGVRMAERPANNRGPQSSNRNKEQQ